MTEISTNLIIYKILKQLSTLIMTAFAIAAGYEWRIAIEKWLQDNIEIDEKNIFVYPIIVTIIAVIATVIIESLSLRFLSSESMKEAQNLEAIMYKDRQDILNMEDEWGSEEK